MTVGLALIISFAFYSFKPKHPLLDLRLFKNRRLAISVITLFMFAGAFFGALLLLPSYYQQVRGESVLTAGLMVIPQGLGAMVTMPIAGMLVDRFPVGRIVPFGIALIAGGMFPLTTLTHETEYIYIVAALFVMGLGMGLTMMPLTTSALKTLKNHDVARGSTLVNITQQVASSVGISIVSVLLTSSLKDSQSALPAIASWMDPNLANQLGPEMVAIGLSEAADAFASTIMVAWIMVVLTLIPALFLPKKHEESHLLDQEDVPPAQMMH